MEGVVLKSAGTMHKEGANTMEDQSQTPWLQETREGIVITVKAVPRASRTEVAGAEGEWLRVRVKAPPVDGKANDALVKFFAETLGAPKGSVAIVSGDTGRLKRVRVSGVSADAARKALRG